MKLNIMISIVLVLLSTLAGGALAEEPLEDLLNDAAVDDVMVVGPNKIFVERSGRLERTNRAFLDDA